MHDTFRDNNEATVTRPAHVYKQFQAHRGAHRLPNSSIFRLLASPSLVAGQQQDLTSCLGKYYVLRLHTAFCSATGNVSIIIADFLFRLSFSIRTFYHNPK